MSRRETVEAITATIMRLQGRDPRPKTLADIAASVLHTQERQNPKPSDDHACLVKLQIFVTPAVAQRIRLAAYHTPHDSLSALIARGALLEVERLEKANGEPFRRVSRLYLKRGRRPKT